MDPGRSGYEGRRESREPQGIENCEPKGVERYGPKVIESCEPKSTESYEPKGPEGYKPKGIEDNGNNFRRCPHPQAEGSRYAFHCERA